ncbi:AAA family ATPase, partial [Candidatus Woesearchaeota archaeon]|nr:AAA family ATPase [Candidatus Woesearchaeota archaeon]
MSEQIFIGREDALKWLNELFSSTPSFGVLYGRRRVGKTELVKKFSENKKHIYFLAGEKADKDNMQDLQKIMGNFLNDDVFSKSVFDSWEDLFNKFTEKIKERTVITIDEFPFLIEHNKSIPSIFQKIWDENLKHKKVMLVLLGSSIRMMETQVLGYQSPLYGRRTGQWKLMPLKFKLLKKFYSNSDFEEIVKFFSFTDGIPTYLQNTD